MAPPDISQKLSLQTLAALGNIRDTMQMAGVTGGGNVTGQSANLSTFDLISNTLGAALTVTPSPTPTAAALDGPARETSKTPSGLGTVTDAAAILAGDSPEREQTPAQPKHGIRAVDVSLEELGTGTAGRAGSTPTFRQPAIDMGRKGGHGGIGE